MPIAWVPASDDINTYPAIFGRNKDIIIVGAVNNDGDRADFSQGHDGDNVLTLSAPGVNVECAANAGGSATGFLSGTSFAAPAGGCTLKF